MSEHRVPMLGASWRRSEDPALSRDPRVRAVVGALATLPAPEPSAAFRTELRAQLVAIAPRIIAESAPTPAATAAATKTLTDIAPVTKSTVTHAKPKHADGALARLRGISLGRPLAVAASVITVFAMLLGGAVWMSQKSLPGDALYGLKRASESVRLSLASNDTEKAKLYLNFAETRVNEAKGLASRATADALGAGAHASGIDSHTVDLISSTLGSADSDVKNATALLTQQAVTSNSTTPLKIITDWAPEQLARLQSLAAAVPDAGLRARAQSSAELVTAVVHRANALAPAVEKGCASTDAADEIGPVPLNCVTGVPLPGTTTPTKVPTPDKTKGTSSTVVEPGATQPVPNNASTPDPGNTGSSSNQPPIHLPTLPPIHLPTPTLPSLPVSVDSCGVNLLGITLHFCPTPTP